MIFNNRNIASGAAFLLFAGASYAIQVVGTVPADRQTLEASSVVERGGTIGSIDLKNKSIVVDSVSYPLSAKAVTIHPSARSVDRKAAGLQVGMQIRFTTSRFNFANQDQITEIWITKDAAKAARK